MQNNDQDKYEYIEFPTPLGTKILLTIFSPILAPIWLLRKFRYKIKSIRIQINFE